MGKFRTPSPGDSISVALRKVLPLEHGVGVRLHTNLQQREQAVWTSKIRYQIKQFSIGCVGRFKPPGSLNSLFSYVPHLSGPNPFSLFTLSSGSCARWLLLVFSQLLSNHHGRWKHLLDWALGARIHIWRPEIADGYDISFSFFFKFYFIFKLYNIVLVLPNIEMNPPQLYLCSPSWTLLPPPSPYPPSGSSQFTSPKHPVSCIDTTQSNL